jgi:hypothetical protein
MDVVRKIEANPTANDAPLKEVAVAACGELA